MGSSILLVVLALLLVLLNGFFVAAEFGLVKLRPTRVKAIAKSYGVRGRALAKVHTDLDAYLSACQLGITLASLGLGWIGEPAFASLIAAPLAGAGIVSPAVVEGISFLFAFFAISYLHIVVGELAPKSMAIRQAEQVGVWTAVPLYGFYWAMYPAIWLLNTSAIRVLRLLRLNTDHGHDAHYSAEELKLILRGSRPDTRFTRDEWRMLAQALDFRDLDVADLMRPFSEAVTLSQARPLIANLERIAQQRFSRYPYLNKQGHVEGMIHLKDIFFALHKGQLPDTLNHLVRPVVTVPPDLPAMDLFRRLREGAPHFAVVAYPGRAPVGFITLDNLLGALVGEIRDEFRQNPNAWTEMDDGSLIGKGSLPIFSLERALGVDIPHEEVESVGGLLQAQLGSVPKEGDRVSFEHFDVVVKKMHGPRILLVRVFPKTPVDDEL